MPDTALIYHDLGIGGDDAGELLDEMQDKFGVLFDGFDFQKYFPNEHEIFWLHIAKLLGRTDKAHKPVSIGHLKQVVLRGKWFDPA